MKIEIHTQPASFKKGWVVGFYDAKSDDGVRYLDDILRYGIRTEEQREFVDGYRAGRALRLGPSSVVVHEVCGHLAAAA